MDYYESAWQLYLLVACLINVLVFLIVKPCPLMVRAGLQALAAAVVFTPVSVLVGDSVSLAPFVAKLVIDVIAGKLVLAELNVPFMAFLIAFILMMIVFYCVFVFVANKSQKDAEA